MAFFGQLNNQQNQGYGPGIASQPAVTAQKQPAVSNNYGPGVSGSQSAASGGYNISGSQPNTRSLNIGTGLANANPFNSGGTAGQYATQAGNKIGVGTSGANKAEGQAAANIGAENSATTGIINNQQTAGNTYVSQLGQAGTSLNSASQEATDQYTQGQNAALQNWQTPNNATEQGIQSMYNQQAQGITQSGLADYGVLAGLGSQATANTIGASGLPTTAGQQAALQGQNLNQASNAFNTASGQANQLRQQGLQAGLQQNNLNLANTQQTGANVFGATNALNQQNYNVNAGLAGSQYGVSNQIAGEQLGNIANTYGATTGLLTAQAQADAAAQSANVGSIAKIGGTVAGALLAGPAGAAAGGALGGAASPTTTSAAPDLQSGANAQTPVYNPGGSLPAASPYGGQAPGNYNPAANQNQYGNYS